MRQRHIAILLLAIITCGRSFRTRRVRQTRATTALGINDRGGLRRLDVRPDRLAFLTTWAFGLRCLFANASTTTSAPTSGSPPRPPPPPAPPLLPAAGSRAASLRPPPSPSPGAPAAAGPSGPAVSFSWRLVTTRSIDFALAVQIQQIDLLNGHLLAREIAVGRQIVVTPGLLQDAISDAALQGALHLVVAWGSVFTRAMNYLCKLGLYRGDHNY